MEQLQSRHGKLITLSWHLRSSIESTAGVQSMLDTYIFFSIWFPPCRKETNIHWNTTIILKEKCQENKHPFWNHQFKNLMNLSESILIYIIIVTYTYPPLLIRFIPTHAAIGKGPPHLRWLGTFRRGKKDNSAGPKSMPPRSSGSQSLQGMAGIKGSTFAVVVASSGIFFDWKCVDVWY